MGFSLEHLPLLEREERMRRIEFFSYPIIADEYYKSNPNSFSENLVDTCSEMEIDAEIFTTFYYDALHIRKNYSKWKDFLTLAYQLDSKQTSDISTPLKELLELFRFDDATYHLHVLDTLNIINLDPAYPFLQGEREGNLIEIAWEVPNDADEIVDRIDDLWNKMYCSHMNDYRRYPFSGRGAGIVHYVTNEFWLPIKPNKIGNGCTFNLDCIVEAAAEALAVEPLNDRIDYLEIIAQLYLEYIDIIPQIIRRYHLSMFDHDASCNELVQKTAYKIFGCETKRIHDSSLRHRGALAQMRKRPYLFSNWAAHTHSRM